MRLDKILSNAGVLSRSQCAKAAKAGLITVDGRIIKDASINVDENSAKIEYKGEPVIYKKFIYIMMNKPEGYVCSNDEPGEHTVFELLDEQLKKFDLFTVGRLDKATLGLVIITNDGVSAHNALSPKHHVDKVYEFKLADEISETDVKSLEEGAELSDGYITKPSVIVINEDNKSGKITLREGKYHQIRRMFASVGNKITYLKRISFGDIKLDKTLEYGQYRELTPEEEESFTNK